jgi:hypothetical protein
MMTPSSDDDVAAAGLELVAQIGHDYRRRKITLPELHSYRKLDLPRDIAVQVASYVRVQWPHFIGRGTPLWESTPYPNHCLHFVLTDGDVLISHAIVSARPLTHGGETFNVYGLSSVFCYPTHRGMGSANGS